MKHRSAIWSNLVEVGNVVAKRRRVAQFLRGSTFETEYTSCASPSAVAAAVAATAGAAASTASVAAATTTADADASPQVPQLD
ncbi:hypothetical protein HZH68_014966 [Vespula germanica]|uniref:Uncharacterized protein n=1 Tax=Vespula germanica TaxID=30212 RepID=A0A834MRX1_VESGE|nr:hypothetical protein HZH68_014966 [Vespula germanica]